MRCSSHAGYPQEVVNTDGQVAGGGAETRVCHAAPMLARRPHRGPCAAKANDHACSVRSPIATTSTSQHGPSGRSARSRTTTSSPVIENRRFTTVLSTAIHGSGPPLTRPSARLHFRHTSAIVVAFMVANIQAVLGGRWELGASPDVGSEQIRQMIGLFAMVQGFEASRYIGVRFAAEQRVSRMRIAQVVSTIVFVLLIVFLMGAFLPPQPGIPTDGRSIFAVSTLVGGFMPWLLLVAAIGSQTSAIIGATSSRSDMLVDNKVPRAVTFPMILVPSILMVFVDLNVAVNLASRVFAAFFTVQASLAVLLAYRKRQWAAAGFAGGGVMMLGVLILGLPL